MDEVGFNLTLRTTGRDWGEQRCDSPGEQGVGGRDSEETGFTGAYGPN